PDQDALMRVEAAIKQVNDLKQPVLPGFFPIASQGIMVYRTQRDVRAVTLKELSVKNDGVEVLKIKPGQILWKSITMNRSLAVLLQRNSAAKVKSWVDAYER